jgi:asparagine synthase (glutamine-hydrolysing)
VTVSLSGDGGDELFGGYNRHVWGGTLWKRVGRLPRALRRSAARVMTIPSPESWESIVRPFRPLLPDRFNLRLLGDKVYKLADTLAAGDPRDLYLSLVSHWKDPASLLLGVPDPVGLSASNGFWTAPSFTEWMMYLDAISYLPDDILTKVDRATMGVSLEGRVPYLDHRVVELAWRIPVSMKVRDGEGKWILRQVLHRYVPTTLIERPKMGFGVPIGAWLRGPLRGWAESLLEPSRLRREGFFNPAPIGARWAEHLSGARNCQHELWDILMFQAWLENQSAPVALAT